MKTDRANAFTLAELLVAIAVLTLLVLIVSRIVTSAANIAASGTKRADTDSQIRPVLDRMALDFSLMVRRSDVDYYVKSDLDGQPGNDVIAFFSNVSGYPTTASQSPLSLVAYRVNTDPTSSSLNRMQRMAKGLVWNGASAAEKPIIFGLQTIFNNWPSATNGATPDVDYELTGPQIFRFEYFYLLKTGVLSKLPGANGMQDVAALGVAVSGIDPKSRALFTECQIGGGTSCGTYSSNGLIQRMVDFDPSIHQHPGDMINSWQTAINNIADMPKTALAGVRIYQRLFYITPLK